MNRLLILLIISNVILCLYLFRYWKINDNNEINSDRYTDRPDLPSANERKLSRTESDTLDVFIATNEWKPLRKDQAIPKGLHVRINLQTGEREAKLLSVESKNSEETESEKTSIVLLPNNIDDAKQAHSGNDDKYAYLKEALQKIANETSADENIKGHQPKEKFRTYDELKKEMSDLNLIIKTDAEVLDEVFDRFNVSYKATKKWCSHEEPELLSILNDLENLVNQVDNALEFSKRNGIADIIIPCLSANSTKLKMSAARVLGAAVQNNAKVQISALRARVIPPLLKNIALEKDYEVQSCSIFALSCLIRAFPLAEMEFIDEGGLSVLLSLFDETSAESLKLQIKVASFFYDLVMENDDAQLTWEENKFVSNASDDVRATELKMIAEKLKQYNAVGLKSKLVDRGWCLKLRTVFLRLVSGSNIEDVVNISENDINHDEVDKVLNAMLPMARLCDEQFKREKTFPAALINITRYYEILSTKDEFYKSSYDVARIVCKRLSLT